MLEHFPSCPANLVFQAFDLDSGLASSFLAWNHCEATVWAQPTVAARRGGRGRDGGRLRPTPPAGCQRLAAGPRWLAAGVSVICNLVAPK